MKTKTPIPKSRRSRLVRTGFCLLLPALGGAVFAQTPPPAAEDNSDIVRMSAFTVSTEKDSGYRASNSIAGTRSNTPIKEVPLNIQVFTKDLVDDLVITSQIDLERYNASLVNGGADVHSDNLIQQAYNSFLFRGFIQNWSLRDGVREYDPIDSQGLARVEIVKGPAAALYGLTYPGGVMNNISKEVDFMRNFTSIRITGGRYGDYRGTIDANYTGTTAGGGKFGVRVNGAHSKTEDQREHSEGQVKYTQINLAWRPQPTTELKFLAETGYREKPNGLGYFSRGETDGAGNPLGNRSDIPLQIFHPEIPWDWNWATETNMRSAETKLYRGTITQSVGDSLTFTGYWQYSDRQNIDSNGWDTSGSYSGASWDALPGTGWIIQPGGEFIRLGYHFRDWNNTMHAYGATGVYKFEVIELKNTLTFGTNVWSERFHTHRWIQPGSTTNFLIFPVRAGINTSVSDAPPPDYFADVASWSREDNTNDYYFAAWQLGALNNRLRTNIAVNRTNLKLVSGATGNNVTEVSKTSPMYGAMFDITREISVFGVHSTSLFPTTDKNSFLQQMPPTVGKSNEIGVKVDLLEGKISGTISYYQIKQTGGSQRDPNAFNLNKQRWDSMTPSQRAIAFPGMTRDQLPDSGGNPGDLVPGAEQESKGFEADLIFQPLSNWQILLSYANNNQEVTQAVNPTTIGQSTTGHIKDQIALLTKYSFTDGTVKGLSVGLGLQKAGKALQDYSGPGNSARYNPSTLYAEIFGAYRFKAWGYSHLVQLNFKNITEQEEFVGWKATGSSARISTERYEVPTEMRITLTYGIDF